jgi:nitrate reductase delta subunit
MTRPVDERAVVLQAASLLLQYPDTRARQAFPTVREAVATLPDGVPRRELTRLVDAINELDPLALQQHYVQVLDQKRSCCLYLTWWTEGETRRRGLALARLKEIYRSRGFELVSTELPDYLPVILEFAAGGDLELGLAVLQENRAGIELLRLALLESASLYAGALEAVCSLLPGVSPQDEAAARALAQTGPPTEEVGLSGYGADLPGAPHIALGPTSLMPTGVRR